MIPLSSMPALAFPHDFTGGAAPAPPPIATRIPGSIPPHSNVLRLRPRSASPDATPIFLMQEGGVCDGLDADLAGYCVAYCEVGQCHTDSPDLDADSCTQLSERYIEASNGSIPPCEAGA